MPMAVRYRNNGNGARCFARFVTLKGLTNKKDIAVSTQKEKMVLTVKEDGLIRVQYGRADLGTE